MAAIGVHALTETIELGAPHCKVEFFDDFFGEYSTDIDPAESDKDYALVWADGEDRTVRQFLYLVN